MKDILSINASTPTPTVQNAPGEFFEATEREGERNGGKRERQREDAQGCLRERERERHGTLTLKDILSIKWNTPELLFVSYLDPASTTTPTVQKAPGEFSDATEGDGEDGRNESIRGERETRRGYGRVSSQGTRET